MWTIVTFSVGHELMADDIMTAWHNGFEGVTSHITEVWDPSSHVTDGGKHDKKCNSHMFRVFELTEGRRLDCFSLNAFVAVTHYVTTLRRNYSTQISRCALIPRHNQSYQKIPANVRIQIWSWARMQFLDGMKNEDVHLRFGKINLFHHKILISYVLRERIWWLTACHNLGRGIWGPYVCI